MFRVAQLCGAVREILSARRVSVLTYDSSSGTLSPLVSDRLDDETLRDRARRWSRVPLDTFPAARTVLLEQEPVAIEDAQHDGRLPPGAAADFDLTSVHLEPLVATEPVGILVIEPAGAAHNPDLPSIVPLVAASVARLQARREPEVELEPAGADSLLAVMEEAIARGTLDGALEAICEGLARVTGARRGAAFLLENARIVPRVACFADGSTDAEASNAFRSAATPLPLVEAALESGGYVLADSSDSPLIAGWWAETLDIGSALAAPLGRSPSPVGVVVVDSPEGGAFSDEDGRILHEAAARLGGVVEMVRAIEERTSNLRSATAVRRLLEEGSRALSVEEAAEALARVTRDALQTEHASVFLAGEDDKIVHVAVDAPDELGALVRERLVGSPARDFRLWRRVIRQRRPLFVDDATESQLIPAELVALLHLRSYVAFPLLSADRALGIVVCSDTRNRRRWTEEERQLVEQLALEGSLVIENAALRATDARRIDELSRQAFHDSLTDLPNRTLFRDRLGQALARTRRGRQSVAVMLLDLDGFKEINDEFGHHAGDQVLVAVAQRLRSCLRPADTVARLGGDEFTILLEDITSPNEAVRVAERIDASLRTPFVVDGDEMGVTTSIGIALNEPGRPEEPSDMLRNADVAMYKAKHNGKSRYEVHDPQAEQAVRGDLGTSKDEWPVTRRNIGRGRQPSDGSTEDNGPVVGDLAD